jgi:hypothetical protein
MSADLVRYLPPCEGVLNDVVSIYFVDAILARRLCGTVGTPVTGSVYFRYGTITRARWLSRRPRRAVLPTEPR